MSCYQIAKVHEKRRANVCPTTCKCGKAKTFQRYPITLNTISQINDNTLIGTDAVFEELIIKTISFDDNELTCNLDNSENNPRLLAKGTVTHTGGQLTGTLTFTSSGAFNGRLGAFIAGQYLTTEFTFSAVAGVNEFNFDFGFIGRSGALFSLFNDGAPKAVSDFSNVAEVDLVFKHPDVTYTPLANGFNVVSTAVIPNNVIFLTFGNVEAEAGKILPSLNTVTTSTRQTNITNSIGESLIFLENNSSFPYTYSIGSGLGQPKTGLTYNFMISGGQFGNASDITYTFSDAESIAVDITNASITIN